MQHLDAQERRGTLGFSAPKERLEGINGIDTCSAVAIDVKRYVRDKNGRYKEDLQAVVFLVREQMVA